MASRRTSFDLMSRRQALALGGAGLLAAGLGGRAFAQAAPAELAIQLNWLETADFSPFFAAEKMGYDTEVGIKQRFIPGGPQVDPVQSVAGGSAPVGVCASVGQAALARASGIPIKIFGALCRTSFIGVISLEETPILTPKDAIGKRIGLQGGARLPWSIICAANGISEDQMTIVPVAGDVTPLVNKQVDGFWGTAVNQHIALELQGIKNHIMTRNDAGAPEHFNVLFAMEDTLDKNRDQIVNWLKAVVKGQQYYIDHAEEIGTYIVERAPSLQLKLDQQQAQAKAEATYITPKGMDLPLLRFDEANANKAIEQLAQTGTLPGEVKLSDILVNDVLDEVYA